MIRERADADQIRACFCKATNILERDIARTLDGHCGREFTSHRDQTRDFFRREVFKQEQIGSVLQSLADIAQRTSALQLTLEALQ